MAHVRLMAAKLLAGNRGLAVQCYLVTVTSRSSKGCKVVAKKVQPRLTPNLIETDRDIEAGVVALTRVCPHMARAATVAGRPPLRRWRPGFDGVVRIVVGQQLSVASADAILRRLHQTVAPLEPATVLAAEDGALRAAGLSAGKLATLKALAAAVARGDIDFEHMGQASPSIVHERLTAVRGIGPWTADIYLVLCRGDRDAFAAGDLALQVAAQDLMGLDERPSAAELLIIAQRWQPWRGVAARLLWSYYAARKADKSRV